MEQITQETDYSTISKINSGGLIVMRLNNLCVDAHNHKRKGEYLKWNADLDAIWCELVGDVTIGDEDDKAFDKINEELSKISPIINWTNAIGFRNLNGVQKSIRSRQYNLLIKKEAFLRRLQNSQGKGTAYGEDEAYD